MLVQVGAYTIFKIVATSYFLISHRRSIVIKKQYVKQHNNIYTLYTHLYRIFVVICVNRPYSPSPHEHI